ncbi:hypothetical protein FA10DRAFT_257428 [Acaromyces ingoldii]|uniref:Uncharacterized protein n=1 Tax=Acaromyces ingoldii TaxID=215250 RepID=A0A316YUX9_9BASI|nr:hypothetical protein FA10DRAFT_257428 [Acaromyces ingoldii]PWN93051.1 hypothetical protein FA10DRAFT_257428 [Acaromyces ingoldii]
MRFSIGFKILAFAASGVLLGVHKSSVGAPVGKDGAQGKGKGVSSSWSTSPTPSSKPEVAGHPNSDVPSSSDELISCFNSDPTWRQLLEWANAKKLEETDMRRYRRIGNEMPDYVDKDALLATYRNIKKDEAHIKATKLKCQALDAELEKVIEELKARLDGTSATKGHGTRPEKRSREDELEQEIGKAAGEKDKQSPLTKRGKIDLRLVKDVDIDAVPDVTGE